MQQSKLKYTLSFSLFVSFFLSFSLSLFIYIYIYIGIMVKISFMYSTIFRKFSDYCGIHREPKKQTECHNFHIFRYMPTMLLTHWAFFSGIFWKKLLYIYIYIYIYIYVYIYICMYVCVCVCVCESIMEKNETR